jgi:hypothetical protein
MSDYCKECGWDEERFADLHAWINYKGQCYISAGSHHEFCSLREGNTFEVHDVEECDQIIKVLSEWKAAQEVKK